LWKTSWISLFKVSEDIMPIKGTAREAKYGEKMIEVKVCFFTDRIADSAAEVVPKNAWTRGAVRIDTNKSHGISPQDPLIFNSLLELPAVIEKVLINHGIILHRSPKMRKYVSNSE
jgi:hypothetical protein